MAKHSQAYRDYLKSDTWKAIRLNALNKANWKCEHCGKRARLDTPFLQVNHKHYRKPFGTELWPDDLETLCVPCHKWADRRRRFKTRVKRFVRWLLK